MKKKSTFFPSAKIVFLFTLLVTLTALNAQQARYKMTTDIPASITTPDNVETSLGTLKFFDGFPDAATVQKVYDNLDFQRGVQTFLTAMPAASACAFRKGFRTFGPDNQTRSWIQTDQQFPMVSSQNKELIINPDGSVDVYFGPEAPEGKENNWIQTIPGKGWFTALRLYGPGQAWFDKTWRPGEIELVK